MNTEEMINKLTKDMTSQQRHLMTLAIQAIFIGSTVGPSIVPDEERIDRIMKTMEENPTIIASLLVQSADMVQGMVEALISADLLTTEMLGKAVWAYTEEYTALDEIPTDVRDHLRAVRDKALDTFAIISGIEGGK